MGEETSLNYCRTCLIKSDYIINLCDDNYRPLFDLLRRLVDFEIDIRETSFHICRHCESKILLIAEFRDQCQSSYNNLSAKRESVSTNTVGDDPDVQFSEDNLETDDNEDDEDYIVHKKKAKVKTETKTRTRKTRVKKEVKVKRAYRIVQYPPELVQKAIEETKLPFLNNRECLECSFVAAHARALSVHMTLHHKEIKKSWCSKCNTISENIEEHIEQHKENILKCRFCLRTFPKLGRLTEHLRSHCRSTTIITDQSDNDSDENDNKPLSQTFPIKTNNTNNLLNQSVTDDITPPQVLILDTSVSKVKSDNAITKSDSSIVKLSSSIVKSESSVVKSNTTVRFVSTVKSDNSDVNSDDEFDCDNVNNDNNDNTDIIDNDYNEIDNDDDEDDDDEDYRSNDSEEEEEDEEDEDEFSNVSEEERERIVGESVVKVRRKRRGSVRGKSDSKDSSGGKIKCRLVQFSHEEVLQAINETKRPFLTNRECVRCGFVGVHSRALSVHMTLLHKDLKPNWCCKCNTLNDNLAEHIEQHKNDILKCQFCGRSFKKFGHLKEHLRSHSRSRTNEKQDENIDDNVENKGVTCDPCGNIFPDKETLEKHLCDPSNVVSDVKSAGDSKKKIAGPKFCVHCNRRVRSLKIHRKQYHNDDGNLKEPIKKLCTVCGKQFRNNSKLTVHMRTHTGESPYKCSYCDKRVATRNHLIVHERIHTGEKPHVCYICGKAFAQSSVLGTHMKIHTGRPEVCTVCDQRFCRPAELRLHMRKHTGEKPFLCTTCGQSFRQRSHLMEHIKIHSNIRPYKCSYCEKSFKQNSSLKSHEQIHTGYKPYKCSQCSYSCRQGYSLTVHMKQHSSDTPKPEKPHRCASCFKKFSTQAMLMSHMSFRHHALVSDVKAESVTVAYAPLVVGEVKVESAVIVQQYP